jgi:ABC-type Fe3+-hydroxamate transport system substrate-binding protein
MFRSARGVVLVRATLACLGLALVAAACGSSASSATSPSSASATRPTTDASLQITSPGPNEVTGRHVEMVMALSGAHLLAPPTQLGAPLRPDRGHIHISVDGTLVAMPARLTEELPVLQPGSHTVQAEFVAADHLPFANRVVAAVTFDVR